MAEYVVVYESEADIHGIEIDLDEDNNLAIKTIRSQFGPCCNRLYFYNADTGRKRGLTAQENKILEPKSGWCNITKLFVKKSKPVHTIVKEDHQPRSPDESVVNPVSSKLILTKKELLNFIKLKGYQNCPSALLARQKWNELNGIIKRKVHEMEWKGSGGFSVCQGTTKEDSLTNCALREEILNSSEVDSRLRTFTLEDGHTLEIHRPCASTRILQCLNDMKRNGTAKENVSTNEERSDIPKRRKTADTPDVDADSEEEQEEEDNNRRLEGIMKNQTWRTAKKIDRRKSYLNENERLNRKKATTPKKIKENS